MKYIKCDRCGQEFPATNYDSSRQFEIISRNNGLNISNDEIDLCKDCETELVQWLANYGIKRGK